MQKICIITTTLGTGGAEKVSANLSFLLTNLGFNVHVLCTKDVIEYDYSGTLFNLELNLKNNRSNFNKIRVLNRYFKENKFDVIIDNRTRPVLLKELVLYKFVFRATRRIAVVHSHNLKTYFPSSTFFANLLYKRLFKLVVVSEEIKNIIEKRYRLKNVKQIYNPIHLNLISNKADEVIEFNEKYILFYGRIEEKSKNLSLLLEGYKKSDLIREGIKLLILGSGDDLESIKNKATNLSLSESVIFKPYVLNPYPYVKKALFTVLTSRYEGFPMVLLEALACGTPIISVDCKSGPKEVLKHGYNGLLIENYNKEALANAMNSFIFDTNLYKTCKLNTKQSVQRFSIENISQEWKQLINIVHD
ncbi:glycosyltransferase [Flavivirga abyssicola]|uniref:glycosyltransferase n=1 Tax=Flavivirga abyssicola TaxID=3063533 RepID=UPI0026E0AF75|nr:glycosyltransferase [Flavivirga sp. MEBiC07777]WVK12043.1 glycosyltransferase [Flavivirga sp. MEBiC07777]